MNTALNLFICCWILVTAVLTLVGGPCAFILCLWAGLTIVNTTGRSNTK